MQAVWYESNGAAADVLQIGELETPTPGSKNPVTRYCFD